MPDFCYPTVASATYRVIKHRSPSTRGQSVTFNYKRLLASSIGGTRKVKLKRRPLIKTLRPQYPDYILAAFADVVNIS